MVLNISLSISVLCVYEEFEGDMYNAHINISFSKLKYSLQSRNHIISVPLESIIFTPFLKEFFIKIETPPLKRLGYLDRHLEKQ